MAMSVLLCIVLVLSLSTIATSYSFSHRLGILRHQGARNINGGSGERGRMSVAVEMGRASNVRAATKARTDSAKAKNNSRYAKKILLAVRSGGGDPVSNRLLAHVIAEAKAANIPKDIIVRNIEKASSSASDASDYKEGLFEFYGHGGAGLLVSVLTDNDNRASSTINLVAKQHGLKHATPNSVSFKFARKVRFDIHSELQEDVLLEMCLEAGVDDYSMLRSDDSNTNLIPVDGHTNVFVDIKDMAALRDILSSRGYSMESRQVCVPLEGFVALDDADFNANMAAIGAFEDLEDVDNVEHNIDLSLKDDE